MNMNQPIVLTLNPLADGGGWKLDVTQPTVSNGSAPRKYELVNDSNGLFRARALRDIVGADGYVVVRAGALSGQLWSDQALSQHGYCWVYNNARVLGRGRVYGNAQVHDDVVVEGNASVYDTANVTGSVHLDGYSRIYGQARVSGRVKLTRGAQIGGNAQIHDDVVLDGPVYVLGGAWYEHAKVQTTDQAVLTQGCFVGNMLVTSCRDVLQVNTCWGTLTVAKQANGQWLGTIGCQRFGSFARLQSLAEDTATSYERDQLEHWFSMMRRLFLHWGLSADVVERTTKLDRDSVENSSDEDDDF